MVLVLLNIRVQKPHVVTEMIGCSFLRETCTAYPKRTPQTCAAKLPRLALRWFTISSAGDLDGDTFFVCWDERLVPPRTVAPADYSGTAEQVFGSISPKDMVHHFAYSDQARRRSV